MHVGPAEEPGALIGPVIDRPAQQRILAVIEKGKTEARLAWQGKVPADANACWVTPTSFTDVPATSSLFREEIFGPVLSITKAKTFEEALALATGCAFALTGGLYSRSPVNIERAKAELVCGNLYINRGITGAIVGRQPFGGFKMSGGGTKAGDREYLQHFPVLRDVRGRHDGRVQSTAGGIAVRKGAITLPSSQPPSTRTSVSESGTGSIDRPLRRAG
jgi:RHH-type proline utilization regulon transcriptional repressor/proline dehydrogenase/delta 1-pyrroline-5-carboxylate dehydrogenase